jgi:hypothetical protein
MSPVFNFGDPPQAHSVETFDCDHCDNVHILLKDRDDNIFATAVLSRGCVENIKYLQAVIDQRRRR